ncbi:PAS domain S-box protein [Pedobacter sp. L105]|uniref:sensor histidine kinase n=1 Tax=Pedobacter sp. L105 TaxID=1641871 RepID=UPI00131B3908|nr:PAS domain S-box protein [Pedobacter sp. L105]
MAGCIPKSLHHLIVNAPYAVAILDGQLNYITASVQWLSDFRLEGDLSGKSFLTVFPKIGPQWMPLYLEALKGNHSSGDGEEVVSLDGSLQWLKWDIQPWLNDTGAIGGIIIYLKNSTVCRKEQAALKRSLDLYQQANEDARLGLWEIDFKKKELFWSAVTKQIYGVADDYQPQLTAAIDIFKAGTLKDNLIKNFINAVESGTGYELEIELTTAKGEDLWVRTKAATEFENEVCVRMYGTFQDIQQQKLQEIQLANSEIKYRSQIENSLYAFLLIIPGGVVIEANQSATDMFGYTLEEFHQIRRHDLLDRQHPDFENFMLTRHTVGKVNMELTGIRKNGEHFPCQISATIYTDSEGIIYNNLVIVDLTERQRAEEQTRLMISDERKLLRTLIDNLPISVYIKDREFKRTMVNRSEIIYMNGSSENDLLGKTDFDLFPADSAAIWLEEDQHVFESGKSIISKETVDKKADGTVNYMLTSKIPLFNTAGEIIGLLGINYDITQIKEAEYALAVSEEKYREIFENIQDIYYRTDQNGIVTEISPSVERYSYYQRDHIIGNPVSDFYFYREDREKIVEALKADFAVTDFEVKLKTRNKDLVYASVNARLIIQDGVVIGSEGSIRDITQRKKQQNELTLLNTELQALNNHREKLLSVIGHDLRNPIAASLKLAELALMDMEDTTKEELTEYLLRMKLGLTNANELLEDLLHWAANQFNSHNFNPVLISDVKMQVLTCIQRLKPMAHEKGLELIETIESGLSITADKDMLDAIIRNLVSNAIKFTRKGHITVTAQSREKDVLFAVSDTGNGISEQVIGQLFRKSSIYTTYGTSGEKGTGLGLELCRDFVEKHDGKIWVESTEGNGSTFYFTIPI